MVIITGNEAHNVCERCNKKLKSNQSAYPRFFISRLSGGSVPFTEETGVRQRHRFNLCRGCFYLIGKLNEFYIKIVLNK